MSEVDGILAHYRTANETVVEAGRRWYPDAFRLCVEIAGDKYPVETIARVMAILSPRAMWVTTVAWTRAIVAAHAGGDECPAVSTGSNRAKAWSELNGEPARMGPKTTAFARAILGDRSTVVIDSWILRTVGLKPEAKVTPARQRWITEAYVEAAAHAGESPRDFQAVVWCSVRGRSQ